MAATRKSAKRAGKKRAGAKRASAKKRSTRTKSAARGRAKAKRGTTLKSAARKARNSVSNPIATVRQAGEKTWEALKSTTAQVVEGVRDRFE